MFIESFKITGLAVAQIFLLGAIGYLLMKKGLLGEAGLDILSRLVVGLTLPLLIFCQLVKEFRYDRRFLNRLHLPVVHQGAASKDAVFKLG